MAAVLATSFARIFYRNALNLGLPVFEFAHVGEIAACDEVAFDLAQGSIRNATTGRAYSVMPLPLRLMEIVAAGGLIPHLERRLGTAG